jgi:chaperonin GroEL
MPTQDIRYNEEVRQALRRGADKVANAVKVTLGPKGRNVIIETGPNRAMVTKDGVTVAKSIYLKDPYENLAATLVKEAASRTNDSAGDGTTTATILAQAIIQAGMKNVTAGANPLALRRGIEKAVANVVTYLKTIATKVTVDDVENVAGISANDPAIGKLIADAMKEIGPAGVLEVEDGKTSETVIEAVKGMRIDRGYASPYMVTNPARMESVLEGGVRVLVTDRRLSSVEEISPLLEKLALAGQNRLLIVCDDVDGLALATLCINIQNRAFFGVAVKAPGFGDRRKDNMLDICALTGATMFAKETDKQIEFATLEDLGTCDKIVAAKEYTTIVGGHGSQAAIDERVAAIQAELPRAESEFDKEKLKGRLARLTGGVGIIRVGGQTEAEVRERKHRIEDAVNATRAALEEGIVPGGGVALLRAIPSLKVAYVAPDGAWKGEEIIGAQIVETALGAPFRALCENAGRDPGEVRGTLEANEDPNVGYNAEENVIQNLVTVGIVDPCKVTRSALENAASAACMLLTTDCAIVEEREEPKK